MGQNEQTAVRFEAVTKSYGSSQVLRRFDLEIRAGDFISLIGPSGCGKTTVLRILAGLTDATEGQLAISENYQKRAYIFQEPTLLPWRTSKRNIELPLELASQSQQAATTRAEEMLELVGMADSGGKFPRQLSGGMKMRVSLARALATEPRLLLMDEPFGALDAITRNRLNEDLLALRESQPFTALFVTHSVTEAVFLSNRIVVLSEFGEISVQVDVPFAYPRTKDLRQHTDFHELAAKVSAKLESAMEEVS